VVLREGGHSLRGLAHDAKEEVDPQREVGRMHEAAARGFDGLADLGRLVRPARGADHVARARGQGAGHVGRDGLRPREVDPDRAPQGKGTVRGYGDLVAPLPQDGLDLAAHLPVAHEGDLHAPLPKNSWCRLRTAPSASASDTTNDTFTSEAPNEIMTMLTARRVWKIRPARPDRRRKARPTMLTMAMSWMTRTSPRVARTCWIAGVHTWSSPVETV